MPLLSDSSAKNNTVKTWMPVDFNSPFTDLEDQVEIPGEADEFVSLEDTNLPVVPRVEKKPPQSTSPVSIAINGQQLTAICWEPVELDPYSLHRVGKGLRPNAQLSQTYLRVDEIIQRAEMEAEEILQKAREKAQQIIQEGEAQVVENLKQGYADGLAASNNETITMLQTVHSIVEEVQSWREDAFEQGEMMMLRLVIEIAQSIFGDGLPLDPDTLGHAFSRALSQAKSLGDLRVYVHPEDATALSGNWTKLLSVFGGQKIELVPSEIIKRGGCFIDGQFGTVDARVETQLEIAKNALLMTMEKGVLGVKV